MNTPKNPMLLAALAVSAAVLSAAAVVALWLAAQQPAAQPGSRDDRPRIVLA